MPPAPRSTSSQIVFLAGLALIVIALYQTYADGHPDEYIIGAVLALALGGGVGRAADVAIKGYVASQVKAAQDSVRDASALAEVPAAPRAVSPARDAPEPPDVA